RRFLRAKAAVLAEGARVGPASRGPRRNKPPRATASVVLLVSGRWERDDAGSWPEIARGDASRRVLPIVIRGVRITPGPITLVIDLGYRCYAPRRRPGRSHERFPGARTRTRASSTTDAKRCAEVGKRAAGGNERVAIVLART